MRFRIAAYLLTASMLAGCASSGGASHSGGIVPMTQARTSSGSPSAGVLYEVVNLGTLGGTSASAATINANGVAAGSANKTGDTIQHAVVWRNEGQSMTELPTLGGPNGAIAWPNHDVQNQVAGISETSTVNPLGEDWSCSAFFPQPPTLHECVGVVWEDGKPTPLSTLGGFDSYAAGTNAFGSVVGWAENTTHDPTCDPHSTQVLQFEPVIWGPKRIIRQLPTFSGDPDGAATAINDNGLIVGISGICDQAVGRFTATHAILWRAGTVVNLGNIGGTAWNTPQDINLHGQVIGFGDLPGSGSAFNPHAFLWPVKGKMHDLGAIGTDTNSVANGINNEGQIVGVSAGANTQRGFVWQNGKMVDLNRLIPPNSYLYIIAANEINDDGLIVGQALDVNTGATPAVLLVPKSQDLNGLLSPGPDVPAVVIPDRLRKNFLRRFGVIR